MSSSESLPSFADLPDPLNPEPEAPETPPQETAASAAPGTQYIPFPVPVATQPTYNPNEADADFLRRMSMWEAEKDRVETSRRMAEAWRQANTPPPLPEDPDELLTDGQKLRKALADRDRWVMDAMRTNFGPVVQRMQGMEQELAESRAIRAEYALRDARAALASQGVREDMNVWNQVESLLRSNPETYWKLRSSPDALRTAYTVVSQQMPQMGQAAPVQNVAQPTHTAGYPGGAPVSSQRAPLQKDPILLHVEKQLGVRFNQADLQRRRIVS